MSTKESIRQIVNRFNAFDSISSFRKEIEKVLKRENLDLRQLYIEIRKKEIIVTWFQYHEVVKIRQIRR